MPGTYDEAYEALMLAVTGDPVPDEVRGDPEFRAEHAAAVADVALLREGLAAAGDALGARPAPEPVPVPEPVPETVARPPVRNRRPLRLAFGALAAAGGLAVASVMTWAVLASGGGMGSEDAATSGDEKAAAPGGGKQQDADLTPEGFVACSRLIVEGTVTAVDAVPGAARDRITLDADHYIKPESGPGTVTFPMDHDVDPRLKVGDRVLITMTKGETEPDNWAMGKKRDRLRTTITNALPGSRQIQCD
ncbi:hypothetical protein AB0O76_02345 [Streptomyces sp. NPDC086554]|uniref:hypothetical protein n=1 Tax=Streptomyces sp. NPDC086554 TaxID=3154864 RepID=UPI00341E8702